MLTEKERQELEQLRTDPAVKLGRQRIYDKDRQNLYRLRWLKKKGEAKLNNEQRSRE